MNSPIGEKKAGRKRREFPLPRLLPNLLTIMSLFGGLTAVRFALSERWEAAALAIVIASILDVLDGRVARLLNSASKFGAELDSLSDLTSFGVAPGFVLYLWLLNQDTTGFGWVGVLVFAACSALRLARFNTMLEDFDAPKWTKGFFTGVPAPAGAGLVLMPLFFYLAFGEAFLVPPILLAFWMIVAGGLMVSRLPTLAMKGRRIAPVFVAPVMAGVCLLAAGLFTKLWATLSVISAVYLVLLPIGWLIYRRRAKIESLKGTAS
ncbi:MAG TPA: CDP-diacylglycerol--serine O-phosphatidyltransferase [Rhodospirillaceae bacterium]|nr:CDP-diacylglycerol--serine O-phosphatidyltransferase [Rhodospirillaceae bacterium]